MTPSNTDYPWLSRTDDTFSYNNISVVKSGSGNNPYQPNVNMWSTLPPTGQHFV